MVRSRETPKIKLCWVAYFKTQKRGRETPIERLAKVDYTLLLSTLLRLAISNSV